MQPPITELPIKTADFGFYAGFNINVTVISKLIVGALVVWAVAFPEQAGAVLGGFNSFILNNFGTWYVYVMASFVLVCVLLAIWPAAGRLKLGHADDEPEFSNFSWFSMMFGAGIGVGMLTWAVAEPIYHFKNNPEVIQGLVEGGTRENFLNAYQWSYLHWGFSAWASYAVAGLSLAYFAYRRGLPLTIRSSLTPLFGDRMSGFFGNLVDIVAVIATVLGVAQTLGFGVYQGDGMQGVADKLEGWQGAWSVFYWAWWVAFAPFVGLFLARISRGRTIREFVIGALIVPAIMCFVWFSFAGGTAIQMELSGVANGAIFGASDGDKIFAMTGLMLGDVLGWCMAVIIVILLLTYLVTSADSAVLIVNTINAAGDEGPKARPHIIFWGVALGAVVAALLLVGGLKAIQTAMVIGALPFSVVMVLMWVSLIKAIYRDGQREALGLQTTYVDAIALEEVQA